MIKKNNIIYILLFTTIVTFAQEGLRPTTANINYLYGDLKVSKKHNSTQQTTKVANTSTNLPIPFIEDFYYAQYTNYPNQVLWNDSSTYINTGYPIAPPSIGVATFDGLNKYGYPYQPNLSNLNSSLPADTLTSKPINLKTVGSQTLQLSDSVGLSFFYQARGNGDSPEITDTLLVDFKNPLTNTWTTVWYMRGNTSPNTNDTIFKRGFIWVDSTYYLNDGFQFRFRNKATTAGNFDHWHVDYIKLDKLRSQLADTTYNDLTFGFIPSPLLKNYSEMPWQQYTTNDMAKTISVRIRNNENAPIFMTYSNTVISGSVTPTNTYNGGQTNLGVFKKTGWEKDTVHSRPILGYTIAPLTDSADIKIQHIVGRSGSPIDFNNNNDTVIQHQRFKNYYAYDDGTCEAGYYVLGQGGKMAVKFNLNFLDTLRSVRIYFDPVGALTLAQSSYKFRINIWQNGGAGPGLLLYRDSVNYPKYYNTGVNAYADYTLTTKQILPQGTYYIGIQQQVANGITVGFDKNLNHNQNLYFDSGSGWTQSSIFGSLMLRPVFGKKIIPVGLNELSINNQQSSIYIYPNPSNGSINYKLNIKQEALLNSNPTFEIKIYTTLGQVVHQSFVKLSGVEAESSINVNDLSNGIYYLSLQSNNQTLQTQKIIIQH